MKYQTVTAHWKKRAKNRFKVRAYDRKMRKKRVRVKILKKPVKLYPRVDVYGRRKGWSSKPPRTYKELI